MQWITAISLLVLALIAAAVPLKLCLKLPQILSAKQAGIWQLHLYPYIPKIEAALDALAEEMQAPTKQQLVDEMCVDSATSEWTEFERYVQYVVAHEPFAYVPLQKFMPQTTNSNPVASNRPHSVVNLY